MEQLQKGDVVRLKSGGPMMTIEETGDYSEGFRTGPRNGASCVWFEGKKKYQEIFDVDVLELVNKQKPGPNAFTVRPRAS